MSSVEIGAKPYRPLVSFLGSREVAEKLLRGCEIEKKLRIRGLPVDGSHESPDRGLVIPGLREGDADRIQRQRVVGGERERLTGGLKRCRKVFEQDQALSTMRKVLGVVRLLRERSINELARLAGPAMLERDHAEQKIRVGELGLALQNLDASPMRVLVGAPIQRPLGFAMQLNDVLCRHHIPIRS